jgi:type II secretion system protein J
MTRAGAGQGGFTFVEVMISLGILSGMMFITWSVTSQIGSDRVVAKRVADRNHELRVAAIRMTADLSMAYISANQISDTLEPRTFFFGKQSGETPLRFSAFAHRVLWADANESEQTVIAYYTAPDLDDKSKTNLLRRESRRMTDERWDSKPAEIDILVHDIEKLELEYWDWRDKDWQTEWDSTQADAERGRLPSRVRMRVTVLGRNRKEVVHETQARITMEEELRFFAN